MKLIDNTINIIDYRSLMRLLELLIFQSSFSQLRDPKVRISSQVLIGNVETKNEIHDILNLSNQVALQQFILIITQTMSNQVPQPEDKTLDSTSALEKTLRLDRKHTNFDYQDLLRNLTIRVSYPQTQPEGPASDTVLKSLWRHLSNIYFKPIEDSQLQRLNYFAEVLDSHNEGIYRFEQSQGFWNTVNNLYSHSYLHRYLKGEQQKAAQHNSLEIMHIVWQICFQRDQKKQKAMQQSYNDLAKDLRKSWQFKVSRKERLEIESRRLQDQIIHSSNQNDQINQEIKALEQELNEVKNSVKDIFHDLETKVQAEVAVQEILFCAVDNNEPVPMINQNRAERRIQKIKSFELQTQYIEYTIKELQKKQIAESISKLQRVERNKGETRIQLVFEQAMGIKPIVVSQQQFKQINALREYSLLKFYNTASKSIYSFVCQNYLGFKDMYEYRNRPCRLKDRDILAQMKKTPPDSTNTPYYKEFAKMEICHHCKLLQPESALVSCEYRSSRNGTPVPPSPYYDSYVHQILKNQQCRVSAIRFLNSSQARRNSYFHYIKKDDENVCGRKYCRFCLKNYQQGREKVSGLCPYCRGICYCTRCSRNETIVRLKSMFVLLGGDINKLQRGSYFERFYESEEQAIALRRKESGHKAVRRSQSAPSRQNEKMVSIRYQLQDLRIVCDLVKRREKNKQKLMNCLRQAFKTKIKLVQPEFNFENLESSRNNRSVSVENGMSLEEKREKEALAIKKKLKRMIY